MAKKPEIGVRISLRIMQDDEDRLGALERGDLLGISRSKLLRAALRLGLEQLETDPREALARGLDAERPDD